MKILERAARALYDRWLESPDVAREAITNGPHPAWDKLSCETQAKWTGDARAVMEAIREPSEAMKRAGMDACGGDGSVLDGYDAMIDAALDE